MDFPYRKEGVLVLMHLFQVLQLLLQFLNLALDIFWVFSCWNYLASQFIFANSLEMTATTLAVLLVLFLMVFLPVVHRAVLGGCSSTRAHCTQVCYNLHSFQQALSWIFFVGVLMLARTGLIFFLVAGAMLCFGLSMRIMLTPHWCLVVAK